MAKGFVNVTHSGNGGVAYYLREGECLAFKHANSYNKEEVLQHWLEIEKNEKLGNKELKIQGRYDARVRTNYVLSMPNSISPHECIARVQSIIDKTPIKDCVYTMVVHKGEKDGIRNQHVHLLVNERILSTQKKDRVMIRKEWLEKSFKPAYEKEFKEEFEAGKSVAPRTRINQGLFEADRKASRQGILNHQKQYESTENLSPNTTLGDALLLQSLKSFEQSFVADQEKLRQAAERRAETERQFQKQQEEAKILAERQLNLSPPLTKEREQTLEKEGTTQSQENEKKEQEIKKEQVKEAPKIRMKFK